jgi:ketosteroid isomerase-like protein
MSQENVEIVKAVVEAWNAGNMDTLRELYDPDVIMRMPENWPESDPFVGREAVMRHWEQQREALDADVMEPISIIDAADRVVLRHTWRGTGHGPEVNFDVTNVFTVRKRKIFYQEFFWDHAEALKALGLAE